MGKRAPVVLILILSACSDGTSPSLTQTVGPEGALLTLSDGASVSIPAGALAADTVITARRSSSGPAPMGAVGAVYTFGPEGLTFAVAATVTLAFDPQRVAEDAVPQLLTAPADSSDFIALDGALADASHVRAETMHFSNFVVAAVSPTKLAGGLNFPARLQVDSGGRYWVDQGSATQPLASKGLGRVVKLPAAGGMPVVITAAESDPKSLAHFGSSLYWANGGHSSGDGGATMAAIMTASDSGSTPATVATVGISFPVALAMDGAGSIYWLDDDLKTLNRMDAMGTNPKALATGQNKARFLAVANGYVYWTAGADGTVNRVAADGAAPPQRLAGGQSQPAGIAIGGTSLYWCNQGDGTVWRAGLDGGGATRIADGQAKPFAIAAGGGQAYWTNQGDGTVMRYDGKPNLVQIARGQHVPYDVAIDAKSVYWTSNGNGVNDGALMASPR